MPFAKAKDGTAIHYKDWGAGPAVLLSHAWPLDADMWEQQMLFLGENGFRVLAHDRRGFGRSEQSWSGYDFDTFADDVTTVLEAAGVDEVALVGISMGGGEVVRLASKNRGIAVDRICLVSSVTPGLLTVGGTPTGLKRDGFDAIRSGLVADRPQFHVEFNAPYFGTNRVPSAVSNAVLAQTLQMALAAGMKGVVDCVGAFSETDFADDLAAVTSPCLIVHGSDDQLVPLESARLTHDAIPGSELLIYGGAPHALVSTHKDRFNADLLAFLRR